MEKNWFYDTSKSSFSSSIKLNLFKIPDYIIILNSLKKSTGD